MPTIALRRKSQGRVPHHIRGINWANPLMEGVGAVAVVQAGKVREIAHGLAVTPNGDAHVAAGRRGRAMSFDGAGDYVDVANPFNPADTDEITMAVWHDPRNLTAKGELVTDTSTICTIRRNHSANHLHAFFYTTGGYKSASASVSHDYGPELLVATHGTDGNMSLYRDGKNLNTAATSPGQLTGTTGNFRLGILSDGSANPYDGLVYVAMWWPRVLSAGDLWSLFAPQYRWDFIDQAYRFYSLPSAAGTVIGRYSRTPVNDDLRRHLAAAWSASDKASSGKVLFDGSGRGRHIRL